MADTVQISLDLIALLAVTIFAGLSLTLARALKGSGLKRGFLLASIAGFVHLVANTVTVAGDLGLVGSDAPLLLFSMIQAVFMILLVLAVRSFFPTWYKAFKKPSGGFANPPGFS